MEGPNDWERSDLERHPRYRRELARGRFTNEMQAWLLLHELAFLEYVAKRAAETGYDLSERITRTRRVLRAELNRSDEESAVLAGLDELQWRIDEERRFPPDKLTEAEYAALKASHPAVFHRLAVDLDRMLNSDAPTVVWSRQYRENVPKRNRVPREPIGELPAAQRSVAALRQELGERFIDGKTKYRQAKISDWRRMANENPPGSNRFAHFEQ